MLHTPIEQFLFVDIETVGISSDYKNFSKDYPELKESFDNYLDWFLKRFPEDFQLSKEEIFVNRAALVPEFCKIICVSFAFLDKEGTIRKQTFFNSDEGQLLRDVNNLLNRTAKLNFVICGHNIKNFDIPINRNLLFGKHRLRSVSQEGTKKHSQGAFLLAILL